MNKKTCIVIVGPTAVGKTAMAIHLARHLGTSIISADSRQCYRELNIGVAKPSHSQLQEVKHYFINSHSIHEAVNAAVFENDALSAVQEIFTRHDYAVVVGGTGLYIDAFCEGLDAIPVVMPSIRTAIIASYNKDGLAWLQHEVMTRDPEFYHSSFETQNPNRLMRALEVKLSTGRSIREYQHRKSDIRDFNIRKVGLQLNRPALYKNIEDRVDEMIKDGLIEEVKALLPDRNIHALNTVGYKELFSYLDGMITLDAVISLIKKNTRHYAKRQLTWFRRDASIRWFYPAEIPEMMHFALH